MHNVFILSLKILTGTPGFLFKIENKRPGNTYTIVSEPIQKNVERSEVVNDGNASGIFIYNPEFSSRRIKILLAFQNCFHFGEEKQTM